MKETTGRQGLTLRLLSGYAPEGFSATVAETI
jgi:hypothetical protein